MSDTEKALATIDTRLGQTELRKFGTIWSGSDPKNDVDGIFAAEKHFFMQLVNRSEGLQDAVMKSPGSVVTAMLDLASMGLSLSPSLGQAYLIPQAPKKGAPTEVQAVPSYKGLETAILRDKIATSIVTQLVHENDKFEYGVTLDGPMLKFTMEMNDRGALKGGFCLIRLSNGDKHVEWMSVKELTACEEAALNKAGGKLPPSWRGGFRAEMQKKCIVRRAIKHVGLTNMPEKVIESIDREVGVADMDGTFIQLIGDEDIKAIREVLPELEEGEQDQWMLRKAEAMGFTSIRDIPQDQLEKIKHDLRVRLENLMAAKAKANANAKPVGGQVEAPPQEPPIENGVPPQAPPAPPSTPPVAEARKRRAKPE